MPTFQKNQTGISLFIVMVIVLLTAIVVAMGFKSAMFNEAATGNTAEYQRTYEAAQALVHDAELDIMRLNARGTLCASNCREYGAITDAVTPGGKLYFPLSDALGEVLAKLYETSTGGGTGCIAGICRPLLDTNNQPYDFWENATLLNIMKARAAHYGQYTEGKLASGSTKSNPRLSDSNSWYWVELLPYDASSGIFAGTELAPTDMNVIYRITALVEGSRNTKSVIQKIVVGKKASSS